MTFSGNLKLNYNLIIVTDVLILLDQSSVHLYCNPICLALLVPFVAKLRNLHLHCLETEQVCVQQTIEDHIHRL